MAYWFVAVVTAIIAVVGGAASGSLIVSGIAVGAGLLLLLWIKANTYDPKRDRPSSSGSDDWAGGRHS
jgi:hypothetical protein